MPLFNQLASILKSSCRSMQLLCDARSSIYLSYYIGLCIFVLSAFVDFHCWKMEVILVFSPFSYLLFSIVIMGGSKKRKGAKLVRLVSTAETGIFYVFKKTKTMRNKFRLKLEFRQFDPVARRNVLFTEANIKWVQPSNVCLTKNVHYISHCCCYWRG